MRKIVAISKCAQCIYLDDKQRCIKQDVNLKLCITDKEIDINCPLPNFDEFLNSKEHLCDFFRDMSGKCIVCNNQKVIKI